jgi:hypothetical protein
MGSKDDDLRQMADAAVKLSDQELLSLLEFLNTEYRARLRRAAQAAALALHPGDEVENLKGSRRLPQGARGTVTGIRRGRILVLFKDHGGVWSMHATLIRKIPQPTD